MGEAVSNRSGPLFGEGFELPVGIVSGKGPAKPYCTHNLALGARVHLIYLRSLVLVLFTQCGDERPAREQPDGPPWSHKAQPRSQRIVEFRSRSAPAAS